MKQGPNLLFVGLQLVVGACQRGGAAARRFQLNYRQRHAIHKHHHIRAARVGCAAQLANYHKLVDDQPIVVGGPCEVKERDLARR